MLDLKEANLMEFPFRTIPPTKPTDFWVGRHEFRNELNQLTTSWALRKDSSICLMWADLGAGKTHTLRYLQHLANNTNPRVLALYSDLPKAVTDFKAIFEQVIPHIPEELLNNVIKAHREKHRDSWLSEQLLMGDRDTPRILWMISQTSDQPQGEIGRKWLRGENLLSSETKIIDYILPIKTSAQAIRTLGTICKLITEYSEYFKVVIMLDEFQRISESTDRKITTINFGIRALFNSCPERIGLMLSYSIGNPETIKFLVRPDVISCVSHVYQLPALTGIQTMQFINELMEYYTFDGVSQNAFTPGAVKKIVGNLVAITENKISPRKIHQSFGTVLEKQLSGLGASTFPIDEDTVNKLYEDPVDKII